MILPTLIIRQILTSQLQHLEPSLDLKEQTSISFHQDHFLIILQEIINLRQANQLQEQQTILNLVFHHRLLTLFSSHHTIFLQVKQLKKIQ